MAKKKEMTEEHKANMAQGMRDRNAVKQYLAWLQDSPPPQRGRPMTLVVAERKLHHAQSQIESLRGSGGDPIKLLEAFGQEDKWRSVVSRLSDESDGVAERAAFVDAVPRFAEARGVPCAAFRKMGVPRDALKEAGLL